MEIKTQNINNTSTNEVKSNKSKASPDKTNNASFSEELKNLNTKQTDDEKKEKTINKDTPKNNENTEKISNKNDNVNQAIKGLNTTINELNKTEVRQSDEKKINLLKNKKENTDTKIEGEELINNDFEIQKRKDIQAQVSTNLNFSSNNQDFSSLMNNENTKEGELNSSAKDLAEEAEILSTMAENIAIANKNKIKTVVKNDGMQKINTNTNIIIEDVVKFDSIIMNKDDVEFFANLVENNQVNLNEYSTNVEGASRISKTLADMLAKSMENNKPLRIDFDNNISVIIKINREGKISADFLPSSQVAEAYLKENLPLLKQRFDENNINYGELNQRNQRDRERDNNRRKDRNNE